MVWYFFDIKVKWLVYTYKVRFPVSIVNWLYFFGKREQKRTEVITGKVLLVLCAEPRFHVTSLDFFLSFFVRCRAVPRSSTLLSLEKGNGENGSMKTSISGEIVKEADVLFFAHQHSIAFSSWIKGCKLKVM